MNPLQVFSVRMVQYICFLVLSCMWISVEAVEFSASHELWWEMSLDNEVSIKTFEDWLGDTNAPTRILMRNHVKKKQYQSVLDVPCGLCVDYYGFREEDVSIRYLGVDVTPKLIARAQNFSIPSMEGNIEKLPLEDGEFEFAYARHILEHLPSFELGLAELIRVASREVYVVFFIKPDLDRKDNLLSLIIDNGCDLYHNRYSKSKIEEFLCSQEKVSEFTWEDADINEVILHIYVNH